MNVTNNLCLKYHLNIKISKHTENTILHKQKKKRFKNLIIMHNIFIRNFLGSILRINSY